MTRGDNHIESAETPQAEMHIEYSPEHDVQVIRDIIEERKKLTEQGYGYRLPASISTAIERSTPLTNQEIAAAVAEEFDPARYEQTATKLRDAWERRQEDFLRQLATLGLPVQLAYRVLLTRYGVGGAYRRPNIVETIDNYPLFEYPDGNDAMQTVFHEIVHLTIEDVIERNDIEHWPKERLVNLVMNKFFPDRHEMQRDPEHAEQIGTIFARYFPDMTTVITEVRKLFA